MSKKYVWYGSEQFDLDKIKNVSKAITDTLRKCWDKPLSKISFGLWASPETLGESQGITWKDFCESEEFRLDRFSHKATFGIKDGAKKLVVDDLDSLIGFLTRYAKDSETGLPVDITKVCLDIYKMSNEDIIFPDTVYMI